jgi:TolB protein
VPLPRARTIGAKLLIALVLGLAACGPAGQPAESPTAQPAGATVRGEELPGRVLFVRDGVVWQWQGQEARPLFGSGEAIQPAWSPEGERIAYIARSNSFSELHLADARGAPLVQLTANGTTSPPNSIERVYESRWVFYPVWTPTAGSIVVAAQEQPPAGDPPADYNLTLALVSTTPGEPLPLYADDMAQAGRGAVSPGGGSIVFTHAGTGPDGRQQLYQLGLASGEAQPVPGAPVPSYDPAFTPDGRWLAFAARDGDRTDIFVLPAEGGTAQRLTTHGAARAPVFAPDGSRLAFLAVADGEAGFDLWVADITSDEAGQIRASPARRLTSGLGLDGDSGLSWAP